MMSQCGLIGFRSTEWSRFLFRASHFYKNVHELNMNEMQLFKNVKSTFFLRRCQSNRWLLINYIYYCSNWSVWPLNQNLWVCQSVLFIVGSEFTSLKRQKPVGPRCFQHEAAAMWHTWSHFTFKHMKKKQSGAGSKTCKLTNELQQTNVKVSPRPKSLNMDRLWMCSRTSFTVSSERKTSQRLLDGHLVQTFIVFISFPSVAIIDLSLIKSTYCDPNINQT